MRHQEALSISLITGLLLLLGVLSFGMSDERPSLADPDIKGWYQRCSQSPGCKIIARTVKILDEREQWNSEPILIMRTSTVIDISLARFKSPKGTIYLVLLVPDQSVDVGLIKLFGGK